MKKKVLAVILSVAMITGVAAGCQSSSGGSAGGDEDSYTVGMTLNLGNLTWAELSEAAKAHGEELGMTVTVQNSNDDATTQVSQIENFIQSGVDAIIVAAVESNSVEDVCK